MGGKRMKQKVEQRRMGWGVPSCFAPTFWGSGAKRQSGGFGLYEKTPEFKGSNEPSWPP
ncbi:hypothetical protein Pan181_20770 [Aeoliella mucimassa]|uniref:Uncharacterized protein n=1 Tax=Aeoliella mucimassa TaxID=2527972 RepID=A0A518AMD4_9BACT|nr:hypothetical protein Pan181_20770 [Aeoliella mucimassa]